MLWKKQTLSLSSWAACERPSYSYRTSLVCAYSTRQIDRKTVSWSSSSIRPAPVQLKKRNLSYPSWAVFDSRSCSYKTPHTQTLSIIHIPNMSLHLWTNPPTSRKRTQLSTPVPLYRFSIAFTNALPWNNHQLPFSSQGWERMNGLRDSTVGNTVIHKVRWIINKGEEDQEPCRAEWWDDRWQTEWEKDP